MAHAMTDTPSPKGNPARSAAREWLARVRDILDAIEATQLPAIDRAAELCAGVIGNGRLVHLFGTGHSRIPVEELFPRYGSFAGFNPIVELSMTNYTSVFGPNGLRQAMFIERQAGLAKEILASCSLAAEDAVIVFSFSGTNTVSVEFAEGARQMGLPVIVFTSLGSDPSRNQLAQVGDVVVDLCVPAQDSLVELRSGAHIGPGSTLAYVAAVNLLRVQTAALLAARGLLPPVILHRSLVGEVGAQQSITAALEEHQRRLRGAALQDSLGSNSDSRVDPPQSPDGW
jgi:uncharacterized phosphosugar-binding protein